MVVMQTETTRRDVLVLNPETVFCVKGTVTKSLSHLTVAIKSHYVSIEACNIIVIREKYG